MRILALETTEAIAGVAAMDDGKLLAQLNLEPTKRSAQSLAPGIKQLLKNVGWKTSDIELVAVTVGPGSFTGLRVGVTTAKTLAYCVGAAVLGIDTLEAIAAACPEGIDAVSVAVDAQRGEVVAGRFCRDTDGWLRRDGPERLVRVADWLAGLSPGSVVSGPILRKLADRLPSRVVATPPTCWYPTAANVGRLADRDHKAGRRDDIWRLVPRYSRRSAAEEKWEQRQAKS